MKTRISAFMAFAAAMTIAGQASAQSVLLDDFSDGNADGWNTWHTTPASGVFTVSQGRYRISTLGAVPANSYYWGVGATWSDSYNAGYPMSDGVFQANVRPLNNVSTPGFLFRDGPDSDTFYSAGLSSAGDGCFLGKITDVDGNGHEVYEEIANVPMTVEPGVDYILKVRAVGHHLSVKAWKSTDAEPLLPQITTTDTNFAVGGWSLIVANILDTAGQLSASFDDVYFEPQSCGADIDSSGFMDLDDFDAFVHFFEAGDQAADFDGSGFVDTDDFDAFVHAFEAGC